MTKLFDIVEVAMNKHPKTRFQQLAKLMEETGELAQALLILDGKSPTKKPVSQDEAIDEIADIMLCCYSLAIDLGADESKLQQAVKTKLVKWIGR